MRLTTVGQFIYRYRAAIAVPFFILLVFFSRPSPFMVPSFALWAAGMSLRIWASGYIGRGARGKRFSSDYRIVNGPYHIFKHPLYLGNFLLVSGTLLLYNPPLYINLLLVILFILEYAIIINAENKYVAQLKKRVTKFHYANIKAELSTIIILGFILAFYLFKNAETISFR